MRPLLPFDDPTSLSLADSKSPGQSCRSNPIFGMGTAKFSDICLGQLRRVALLATELVVTGFQKAKVLGMKEVVEVRQVLQFSRSIIQLVSVLMVHREPQGARPEEGGSHEHMDLQGLLDLVPAEHELKVAFSAGGGAENSSRPRPTRVIPIRPDTPERGGRVEPFVPWDGSPFFVHVCHLTTLGVSG